MRALFDDQTLLYVIYTGITLGVLLAFTALRNLFDRRENRTEARSRRLQLIEKGQGVEERLAVLKPRDEAGLLSGLPFVGDLPQLLRRAGLRLPPAAFVALCLAIAAAIFVALLPKGGPFLAGVTALLSGFGAPYMTLKARVRKQTEKLIAQLPDALELLARGLKVGHPLNTSIGSVAQEMPDPIGTEFGIVFDQVNYGEDLPDAFADFARRVDIEDVHYLSSAIGIQHGSGGDLARVIEVLARVIRNRIAMRRKIRAISAEGRLTANFLSVLPFVMFGVTNLMSPTYYGGVMDDPLFMPIGATVLLLVVLNALILRKVVDFHV